MGGCYSKNKTIAKNTTTATDVRPFFRQNSVESIHSSNEVWTKRKTVVQLKDEPVIRIETVLHNDWWHPSFYEEIDMYELDGDLYSDVCVYSDMYSDCSDVYDDPDTYSEPCVMKSHSVLKKPRPVRLSPIPRPVSESRKRQNGVPKPTIASTEEITQEQSDCMQCSEMVQIFKPLLVQNLLIHDILPHLHFLDGHDDLYEEMKTRSQKHAVVSLLDELERSEELGKWKKFMDVLNICGYSFIVDNIRGYRFINHDYQKKYIKEIAPIIGKAISPPELMPHLMAHDLLSDTDKDNILCECNIRGDYAGAIMLLDRIPRKHKDWYIVFIQALEDAGLDDVAVSLKIEKLMDNGRTKDCDGYEMFGLAIGNTSHKPTRPITSPICEEPPLIPPRIPLKNKWIVPILKIDNQACTDEKNVDEVEESKFSDLKEEINKLEQEEHELDVETSLLKKKSDCFKKVISHKKEKHQIQEEITSLEIKKMALEQDTELYEFMSEIQNSIDDYYPGTVHSDKDSGIGKVDENLEDVYW